jgi:large subunit ribosomal protein L14
MIQKETYLNIIDNTGVKKVSCIHIYGGYRKRYAHIGDIVLTAVKSVKSKNSEELKYKKGDIAKVLILYTNKEYKTFYSDHFKNYENAGVIISANNKIVGSRIFGSVNNKFRFSKFLKVVTLSKGVYK